MCPLPEIAYSSIRDRGKYKFAYKEYASGNALRALIKIGNEAVESLTKALEDKNTLVRKRVAFALGEIGDERAIRPLQNLLNDEDEEVREVVKASLSRIKAKKSEK